MGSGPGSRTQPQGPATAFPLLPLGLGGQWGSSKYPASPSSVGENERSREPEDADSQGRGQKRKVERVGLGHTRRTPVSEPSCPDTKTGSCRESPPPALLLSSRCLKAPQPGHEYSRAPGGCALGARAPPPPGWLPPDLPRLLRAVLQGSACIWTRPLHLSRLRLNFGNALYLATQPRVYPLI